jgi:chromosome segregation ATPase
MNKKNILIGALVIVALVLLYFLLHEPKPIDSHSDDYTRVLADNKAFEHREDSIQRRVDSLETDGRAKDSIIAALKVEKKATQKQADNYAATANRLAKEVKELRQGDTSEFARKCDSLAEAAINFKFLYEQYKDNSDSLTAQIERQSRDYASALMEQKKLYGELKKQYDALLTAYKTIFDDYAKNQKTIRRERLKTKIAALLALIGGAAAVLK